MALQHFASLSILVGNQHFDLINRPKEIIRTAPTMSGTSPNSQEGPRDSAWTQEDGNLLRTLRL